MKPICFRFDIFGKKICIPIYYEKPKFPWEPDPDPIRQDPTEPQPWRVPNLKELMALNRHLKSFVKNGLLDEKTISDVAYLGLLNEVSTHLNPVLQERFQGLVKESVAVLNQQDAFVVNIG